MHKQTTFILLAPSLVQSLPIGNMFIPPELLSNGEESGGCLSKTSTSSYDKNVSASLPGKRVDPRCLIEPDKLSDIHQGSDLLELNTTLWHPIAHRPLDVDKRLPVSTPSNSRRAKRDAGHGKNVKEWLFNFFTDLIEEPYWEKLDPVVLPPIVVPDGVNPNDYGNIYDDHQENIAWKYLDLMVELYETMGHKDNWKKFKESGYSVDGVKWWKPAPPPLDDRIKVDSPIRLKPSRIQDRASTNRFRTSPTRLEVRKQSPPPDMNPWNWSPGPWETAKEVVPTRAAQETGDPGGMMGTQSVLIFDEAEEPAATSTSTKAVQETQSSTSDEQ